jgi:glycosyltransferase involved in cell wall biosynthesis
LLPFGAALAGKLIGEKVYYHVQETHIKPKLLYNFLCAIVQRTASEIIFVSKYVKDSKFYVDVNQTVIYNALPNDFYLKASEGQYQHLDDDRKFNVLMICSLKSYKGVEEFVKIASSCQNYPLIKFLLVLNATKKEIDNYFTPFIIPSNLSFIDRQKNLYPYYTKASLLLNLSRIEEWVETFGLTILEAMAFGVPVIVPPVGGPLEIVKEGVEGFLISSNNVDEIAHKILELSTDKKQCMKLSKNAVKRAKTFNEETFKRNILEILRK